nr:putative gp75-like protein [Apis mellifera nudivirus]
MEDLSRDALNTPEFESYIREFYRLTSNSFTLATIAPLIESMKESKILEYIMRDPTHSGALSCLRNYLQSRPMLPSDFIGRFVSVVGLKVNVLPSYVGLGNRSYVAKVVQNNIRPTANLTNISVNALKDQLRQDIKNSTVHVKATPTVATEFKPRLTQNTINVCVNAMSDLCRVIVEGNRANGREAEPYIKSQIKYA